MQSVIPIALWLGPVLIIPPLYYLIGGLRGKTMDDLRFDSDTTVVWVLGLLFWPASILGVACYFLVQGVAWLVTWPARRNQEMKEREGHVNNRLYKLLWTLKHRQYEEPPLPEAQIKLLQAMPWRDAEDYLKRKELL